MNASERGYWVCAAYQHLRVYSRQADNIDEYEVTLLCGETAVLLNAVRGRGMMAIEELERLGKAQKIGRSTIRSQILPGLARLASDRVMVLQDSNGRAYVEEHLATMAHLYEVIGEFWESIGPTIIERGTLHVLNHTYTVPRTRTEELTLLVSDGLRDSESEASLGVTTSFEIVKECRPVSDEGVLFNPYIWRGNHDKIAHAIIRLPDVERDAVTHSMEVISARQGCPVADLGVDRKLLTAAHSLGLVDLVEVNTGANDRQEFAFTPHLTTHPNLTRLADDLLNDVRAVLACITYGEKYSRISKLGGPHREKTVRMLRKLLAEEEAGDATAIGVDYQLLEARGIIAVEPTPTWPGGRFKMRLLRAEPIKVALQIIEDALNAQSSIPTYVNLGNLDPGAIFATPEHTRIISGQDLGKLPTEVLEARAHFLKSIRQEVF